MKRRRFLKTILFAGLATAGITGYNIGTIGFSEMNKFIADSFKDTIPRDPRKLDDSHAHFNFPKNDLELKVFLNTLLLKVDRQAITSSNYSNRKLLRYSELLESIKKSADSDIKNHYSIENKGLVAIIKKDNLKTEIYHSQEIRTLQGFHIIAEGCEIYIHDSLDASKTIDEIHKQEGIAIIAHPFTVERGPFVFWYPNKEQRRLLEEELLPKADSVEVFNAMNILHMILSNSKIKYLMKDYINTIKGIAVTDLHKGLSKQGLKQIGKAGILYNEFNTDKLTDREIFNKKRTKLRSGNYELVENYIDLATFFRVID
ncbi:hypothetical protein HYX19_03325 [Candidatus Woesearchaeota archaeon]|nr:hypothetical protein [Candidatus Woesearchaeota archaeon]